MNNIKKPRLKKNLDKGYLNEIKGSDIICDLSFSDEKSLNDIKDIEFNGCLFKNIDFSDCRLKNVDFINCSFESCNLPNMDICEKLISRCEFINSSLVGFSVIESNLKDVSFYNSNISYMNMSSKLKNVSFTNSNMTGARLFENEFNNVIIDKCNLTDAEIYKTKLNNMDLSNSVLNGINADLESIKGVITDLTGICAIARLFNINIKF